MQVSFLQSHSTCFGRKRPSSGVFKTSTAATGTCVIVAGKSSHLLIRAGTALISSRGSTPTVPCGGEGIQEKRFVSSVFRKVPNVTELREDE